MLHNTTVWKGATIGKGADSDRFLYKKLYIGETVVMTILHNYKLYKYDKKF